ncbi:MAG: trypsin-like peptidase domain-containing protein [Thermoflexales bacterium]|nr:trypsin-like peptidase domain-containing protein [Thermoflexales bacterium]
MLKRYVIITLVLISVLFLTGCSTPGLLVRQASRLLLERQEVVEAAAAPTPTPQPPVVAASGGAVAALEGTLENIYARVNPSVVHIRVVQKQQLNSTLPQMPDLPDIPGFQFGQPDSDTPQEFYQQGVGSGFVWDKQGHIVTNNHVVAGADKIEVTFSDGTIVPAELVGADPDSDLAVVKVDLPAGQLYPVEMADSTQVKVGELVVAIGNPFGLQGTMTVGFVSALGRSLPTDTNGQGASYTIPDIIQTDASLNPGNSGGVLVDDQGRVIGVPSAIESSVGTSAGVGFVIPSAIVQNVVPELIRSSHYDHPRIGISGTTLTPDLAKAMDLPAEQRGVLVIEVMAGSAADRAGLRGSDRQVTIDGAQARVGGDVITAIDGQEVKKFDDLVTYLARSTKVGQTITLTVLRQGQEKTLEVTLEARQ